MVIIGFMLLGSVIVSMYLSIELICLMLSLMIFFSVFLMGNYFNLMNLEISGLGGDIFSYSMVMLSMFISLLMLMGEGKVKGKLDEKVYKLFVMVILFMLYMCFMMVNVLMFYLFFELVLIPMLLLILFFGYQPERLESGVYMLMYTMFGSLPLLIGILLLSKSGMSLSFMYMYMMKSGFYMDWWLLFMLAFLIKLPMYMFHIWLPKAHVEAPVSGSMILAGVLLKLGCYGLIRFSPYMLINNSLLGLFMVIGLWGGILSAIICMRQLDMKKLIAYSSVVHMGMFLGGMSSLSGLGIFGGLIMSIGHGLCSSGLFYMVNIIYERLFTRSLLMSKGMLNMVPWMMMWSFLLSAANSAAPPFLNIFGEIFLGMGILYWDLLFSLLLLLMYFISVAYGIYFYSIICHGKGGGWYFLNINIFEYLVLFLHFIFVVILIFFMKSLFI